MTAKDGRLVEGAADTTEDGSRPSSEYLWHLLGSLPDISVFGVDLDLRYRYFNPVHATTMLALCGREIAVGEHFPTCLNAEEDRIEANRNFERALAGETHAVTYVFGEVKDIHFESWFSPIVNATGEVIGASCCARDISARARAEAAVVAAVFDLKAAERRLTEQQELAELRSSFALQERYRRIVESSDEGIWTIDVDACTDFVNERMATMMGYTREEMIGRPLYDFIADELKPLAEIALKRRKQGIAEHHQFCLRHKSGAEVWLAVTSSPIYDVNGVYAGALALVVDAKDRTRGERSWGHIVSQSARGHTQVSIRRFAGGIAHLLNALLETVRGHADRALGSMDSTQVGHAELSAIRDVALSTAQVTRQLRIIAGTQPRSPEVIDVHEVIGGALARARSTVGTNVDVLWTPETGIWPVLADPALFVNVGKSLFLNAYDAINGEGTIIIEAANVSVDALHCAQFPGAIPGDYVRLTFENSGRGVAPSELLHVFEPFFGVRADETETGLRLAAVYGSVRQGGGFIEVSSLEDSGFTFRVYLPRYVAEGPDA